MHFVVARYKTETDMMQEEQLSEVIDEPLDDVQPAMSAEISVQEEPLSEDQQQYVEEEVIDDDKVDEEQNGSPDAGTSEKYADPTYEENQGEIIQLSGTGQQITPPDDVKKSSTGAKGVSQSIASAKQQTQFN